MEGLRLNSWKTTNQMLLKATPSGITGPAQVIVLAEHR
jgi:hypothetical protein